MRNFTIKRNKSFVGCANKLKVYIEDSISPEIEISGVPCRKLGILKNGKEETFQIDYAERKVFVIADKISKNYCNDYYVVPEGYDDVYVTGQNRLDPAKGNAFLFDVISNESVIDARKKSQKRGIIIIIILAIIGILLGTLASIFDDKVEPKTFSSNGLTITLTTEFEEQKADGFDVSFSSSKIGIFAFKELFYEYGYDYDYSNITLEEYAELLLEANNLKLISSVETVDGLTYFEYDYTNDSTGIAYVSFSVIYKGSDGFWMIAFDTTQKKAQEYRAEIIEMAKSVQVD